MNRSGLRPDAIPGVGHGPIGLAPVTRPIGVSRRREPASAPAVASPTPARTLIREEDQASSLRRLVESCGGSVTTAPVREQETVPADHEGSVDQWPVRLARSIAVASGKGGVGKTNLCVNLAISLARRGYRTTLIDGDLGLANADVLCGVTAQGHLGHVVSGARRIEDITIDVPGGFRLVPGAAGIADLADLEPRSLARLLMELTRLERSADAIVIDCGAGIGRGVLGLMSAADLAVIVATPEPTSIADAYALLKCVTTRAARAGAGGAAPSVEVFVNQAADSAEAAAVHGRIGAVAQRFLGTTPPMAGWAPSDEHVRRAVRARKPVVLGFPDSPAAKAVTGWSESVAVRLGLAAGGLGAAVGREARVAAGGDHGGSVPVSGRGTSVAGGLVRRLLGLF